MKNGRPQKGGLFHLQQPIFDSTTEGELSLEGQLGHHPQPDGKCDKDKGFQEAIHDCLVMSLRYFQVR